MMVSTLRPVEAVECPSIKRLVDVNNCENCECLIEIRRPWSHFIVKCAIGDENGGVYQ